MSLPSLNVISLVGDLKRGGWIANCRVDNDIDLVVAGDSISLSAKSVFNPTEFQSYFNGTVVSNPDNLTFTRLKSSVSFQVVTMDTLLSGESIQAIGFTEQGSPANDHQIASPMLLSDIIDHIIRRHANPVFDAVTNTDGIVTALNLLSAESVNLQRYNTQKSNNFWQTLQKIGGGETAGEFFRPFFNRKNEFFYQPAPFFLPTPPASKGTIDKRHIWGAVRIKFNNNQPAARTGQVNIVSVKDFETVFKSQFPLALENGKIFQKDSGIFASSQAEGDRNAERLFKWLTRDYTLTIDVDPALILFGEDGNGLDLADKIHVFYDGPVEDADTGSGMTLEIDDDFYIYGVNIKLNAEGLSGVGTLQLEIDNP